MEQSNNVRLKFKDVFLVDNLFSEEEINAAVLDIDQGKSDTIEKLKNDLLGSINGKYAKKNNNTFVFYNNHSTLPKVSAILNLRGIASITLRINDKRHTKWKEKEGGSLKHKDWEIQLNKYLKLQE